MERLQKGGAYHFISIPYFKVCTTHDEHFESDDERFDKGNYFPDTTAARQCFNKIENRYGERVREIARERKNTEGAFTQKAVSLALAGRAKDADTAALFAQLVEANDTRKARMDALHDEFKAIETAITDIIRKSPKTL